jgi:hypothetical protein
MILLPYLKYTKINSWNNNPRSLSPSFNLYSCQKKHKIKKCFVYPKNGHSENVQFLKSATTFFSEKHKISLQSIMQQIPIL